MRTDDPGFIQSVEIILHFDNKGATECPFCRKFIKWAQEFDGTINEAWEQATELYQSLGLLQTLSTSERLGRTYDPENPKPYIGLLNRDIAIASNKYTTKVCGFDAHRPHKGRSSIGRASFITYLVLVIPASF